MLLTRKSAGFNPYVRTSRRARRSPKAFVAGLASSFGLAAMLSIGSATPAYAAGKTEGFIVSTKSVSAPRGFHGVCQRYAWACGVSPTRTAAPSAEAKLRIADRVNRAVNRQVREISDRRQYRQEEVWALPTSRGGDCEDFALLKKRELMARGIPAQKLLIATVLDRKSRPHAVLILRTSRGDFVLDNLTSRIKPWKETGYSFLRMQNPERPHQWIAVLSGGIFDKSPRAAAPGV